MASRRRIARDPVRMGPDWSVLPAGLIQLISEKIVFKEQYDQLRLVCRQWRESCPPQPRHLIGQVPWLLFPHHSSPSTFSFYDFSRSKVYNVDLPDTIHKNICGNSHGWILLEEGKKFSMINPVTREMKDNYFPSLDARPNILPFARTEKTVDLYPMNAILHRMILTSSPSDEGCIAIAQFFLQWELGFCKMGDSCWTILRLGEYGHGSCTMSDFKYKNGFVYAINFEGQVTVYDLKNLSRMVLIDDLGYALNRDQLYLVIKEGVVPLVVRNISDNEIEVYKCTIENGRSRYKRVRNIGNHVLLLDYNGQCEIVSLNNTQLNGWKENHMYYLSRDGVCFDAIKTVSIEHGSIREAPISLRVLRPTSFCYISWFTPSMC